MAIRSTVRRTVLSTIAACAAVAAAAPAVFAAESAADYPSRPIRLVVPFGAGGSTDMVARAIALQMQEKLGQTFLVDNRPGATGTIGAAQVKRAAADGYTLMVSSLGTYVVAPHLLKGVPYDALHDFD